MRLLLAEDDLKLARALDQGLRRAGYGVDVAHDGNAALLNARVYEYDAAILDVMLPARDGFDVCRTLRAESWWTPVLLLTARDQVADRIHGLDAGADDYLVKPFDFGELLARVRALQRRPRGVDAPVLRAGRLELDPVTRTVTANGREITLTSTEYRVMEVLLRRAPAVVDRKAIAEHAWADETEPLGSNAIDVQLSRLRAKLPDTGIRIVTVRGAGYRVEEA